MRPASSNQAEGHVAHRGLVEDLHGLHVGPIGPLPRPRDEPVNGIARPLEGGLHPSVGEVADEPSNAALTRETGARGAEEHTLHVPRHEDAHALHGRILGP